MKIKNIDTSKKIFIVAEIGNNHEGNFKLAKKMIEKAALAKVDAVKFQTFIPEHLFGGDEKRLNRLKSFKFTKEQFEKLAKIAKHNGLIFFSTPFDIESAIFLNKIQPIFKIASGDINFYPLIKKVASFGKPMILSTGSAYINLIKRAYNEVAKLWDKKKTKSKLAFLHCTSGYPVPFDQANIGSILYLKKLFPNIEIGYSDHTLGLDAAVSSVFAGARIIEKHFTIDKNYSDFRDHHLSADFVDMKHLVEKVRKAEIMFGIVEKKIQQCEKDLKIYGRRSIAASRYLQVGTKIRMSDLIWIRPAIGLPPGDEKKLIGKKVTHKIKFGEIIKLKKLKKLK